MIVLAGLGNIFTPLQAITRASSASVACFKIIDLPKTNCGGLQPPTVKIGDHIKFENVRFTYPSRPQTEVLKGLNFTIQNSRVTAFVGHSGCGKSTIVALLERWYELSDINEASSNPQDGVQEKAVTKKTADSGTSNTTGLEKDKTDENNIGSLVFQNAGRIMVGEHNLEEIDCKWWRSQIGLVQQEPVLFNETIYENVAKGLIGSEWESASRVDKLRLVEEACKEALAHDFVQRLPKRYDTMVGDSGIKLSGGQRQRLAIARSIIKRPSILILDEATSSIDVRGEQLVAAALERASKGRTTIVIAHRLSTIRRADHIIVLQEGSVVEEGMHDEMVAKDGGFYSNLVRVSNFEISNSDNEDTRFQERDPEKQELDVRQDSLKHKSSGSSTAKTKVKESFRSIGTLLREQQRYYPLYFLVLAGAMGAGAAVAIQAWLFSHVIVVFQEPNITRLVDDGNFWSLMLFVLAICAAVSYATIGYFSNTVAFRVSTAYRKSYFHSVLTKPISWFDEEDHSFGTLTGQLSSDPQQLQEMLGVNIAFPLIAIFNLIGCTIISFVFGWKLSLVVFFASLPVILVASFFRIRYEMSFVAMNTKVFAESSKFAAEAITSFRTVTALSLEGTISNRYEALLNDHIHDAFKKARYTILVFALSDSLEFCSMALGLWYGGQLLARREYEPLQFFVIYAALVQGAQGAGQFLATGPNFANATTAANRILDFRQGSEPVSYESISGDRNDESAKGCKIEFREVCFQYPTRDVPVYRDLSFIIEPGQYVAFVGPSGCGKTTIISFLERFYNVDTGSILIDNQDIATIPLTQYRTLCGLVTQEPTLFEGTVRENLTLGLSSGIATSQSVIEAACNAAEIHDFVTSLPQSYDTLLVVGTHSSLSGGQKQRLCIARALLRSPRMLLLDEATNSLDGVSEGLIQKAIEELGSSKSLTIIAVAHRLATVQRADRIIVLGEGGVLLEDGTHRELIQKKGVYWEMCKVQALDQ